MYWRVSRSRVWPWRVLLKFQGFFLLALLGLRFVRVCVIWKHLGLKDCEMGQCYGREAATSDESDSWKNTAGKRRSTGGIYALHSNCISNGTKNTLSFARHQRGKLYILRRCITMLLLWHKHSLK